MRRLLALLPFLLPALAQGRLEAGVYLGPRAFPTLEAGLTLGEGEALLRLQGGRGALGYLGSLALGPLGYLAYGVQGGGGGGGPGRGPLPGGWGGAPGPGRQAGLPAQGRLPPLPGGGGFRAALPALPPGPEGGGGPPLGGGEGP